MEKNGRVETEFGRRCILMGQVVGMKHKSIYHGKGILYPSKLNVSTS